MTRRRVRSAPSRPCPGCGDKGGLCLRAEVPAKGDRPERSGWICAGGGGGSWPPFLGDPGRFDVAGRGVGWIPDDGGALEAFRAPVRRPEEPRGDSLRPDHPDDAAVLDRVYRAVMSAFPLHKRDRHREMEKRGIPPEDRAGVLLGGVPRSWQDRQAVVRAALEAVGGNVGLLSRVPGFGRNGRGGAGASFYVPSAADAAYLLPCRDDDGRVVALRVRYARGEVRYRVLTGTALGRVLHVVQPKVVRDGWTWCATEGEWKAEALSRHLGLPVLALPGFASSWERALAVLARAGAKAVLLAFDADAWTKHPGVAEASLRFALRVEEEVGAEVRFVVWDAPGGTPKGADDAIQAGVPLRVVDRDGYGALLAPLLERLESSAEPTHAKGAEKVRASWAGPAWEDVLAGFTTGKRAPQIRPRVGGLDAVPAVGEVSLLEARAQVRREMERFLDEGTRTVLAVTTGTGKTFAAVTTAAAFARSEREGVLVVALKTKALAEKFVRDLRAQHPDLPPDVARFLFGRQYVEPEEDWTRARGGFGFLCRNPEQVQRSGRAGRNVYREVCSRCPFNVKDAAHGTEGRWCRENGYLRDCRTATRAGVRVIVTTHAKVARLPDKVAKKVWGLILDEDPLPSLFARPRPLGEAHVERALEWMDGLDPERFPKGFTPRSWERHVASSREVRPLLLALRHALEHAKDDSNVALVDVLDDSLLSPDGLDRIRGAIPRRVEYGTEGGKSFSRIVRDPSHPADFERRKAREPGDEDAPTVPLQWWGRFLSAIAGDVDAGDSGRSATVRIVKRKGKAPRVRYVGLDVDRLTWLRSKPVMVLDATANPALAALLRAEERAVRCRVPGRVVQVLASALKGRDLVDRRGDTVALTPTGLRVLTAGAGWTGGRPALWVVPKSVKAPLVAQAAALPFPFRAKVVHFGGEDRGHDFRTVVVDDCGNPEPLERVVILHHAKNVGGVLDESRAIRNALRRLGPDGLRALEALEARAPGRVDPRRGTRREWVPWVDRSGRPVRHAGAVLERAREVPADAVAAVLYLHEVQAEVAQAIGRTRSVETGLPVEVLLLRGDVTVPVDDVVPWGSLRAPIPAGLVRVPAAALEEPEEEALAPVEEYDAPAPRVGGAPVPTTDTHGVPGPAAPVVEVRLEERGFGFTRKGEAALEGPRRYGVPPPAPGATVSTSGAGHHVVPAPPSLSPSVPTGGTTTGPDVPPPPLEEPEAVKVRRGLRKEGAPPPGPEPGSG